MDPVSKTLFSKKSFWKEKKSRLWAFFCPLCKVERKLAFKPNPWNFRHFSQIALTSLMVTGLLWNFLGPKGLVSFIPLWAAFEIYYRTRVRAAVGCPQCGFDAYLYLTDVKRAREEVERYWRQKFTEKGIPYPEKGKPSVRPVVNAGNTASQSQTKSLSDDKNLSS